MFPAHLRAAWQYRDFILSSIIGEFRARVARSRLGLLWIVIPPVIQVLIYSLVLSSLMSSRLPGIEGRFAYSIYLTAGFAAWFLFLEIVSRSLTIFIDNASALKKIAFPRISLPIIALGSSLINNLILVALIVIFYTFVGHFPGAAIAWLPALLIVNAAFSLGVGLTLGVLNVFIRDVGQLSTLVLQVLFWMTPIVYMIDIIPDQYVFILRLNPIYWLVDNYHRVLVFNEAPNANTFAALTFLTLLMLALAFSLFRKANSELVDAL
jgi:lipopolysaccharide transport system permease protein